MRRTVSSRQSLAGRFSVSRFYEQLAAWGAAASCLPGARVPMRLSRDPRPDGPRGQGRQRPRGGRPGFAAARRHAGRTGAAGGCAPCLCLGLPGHGRGHRGNLAQPGGPYRRPRAAGRQRRLPPRGPAQGNDPPARRGCHADRPGPRTRRPGRPAWRPILPQGAARPEPCPDRAVALPPRAVRR